jgi:hypothetical protein
MTDFEGRWAQKWAQSFEVNQWGETQVGQSENRQEKEAPSALQRWSREW